tara:strand:- start:1279 stop:1719 length:441 start_codon:yes stop_codon:yes gene_type:complete
MAIDYKELKKLATFLREEKMQRIKVSMDKIQIELEAPWESSNETNTFTPPASMTVPPEETSTKAHSGMYIKSPMVGTVYLAPEPGAEPFVKVGQTIRAGDTVCVIEAMKMFTKIKSEFDGVVGAVLVENESAVEYATELFTINPNV